MSLEAIKGRPEPLPSILEVTLNKGQRAAVQTYKESSIRSVEGLPEGFVVKVQKGVHVIKSPHDLFRAMLTPSEVSDQQLRELAVAFAELETKYITALQNLRSILYPHVLKNQDTSLHPNFGDDQKNYRLVFDTELQPKDVVGLPAEFTYKATKSMSMLKSPLGLYLQVRFKSGQGDEQVVETAKTLGEAELAFQTALAQLKSFLENTRL